MKTNSVFALCVTRLDQQCSTIPCQGLVLGNQWRELENMKAQFVAVNGIRKVACVVSFRIIIKNYQVTLVNEILSLRETYHLA